MLTGLSSAILVSGSQTYISIKLVTFEIPYIIQHLAMGAKGALSTLEPSLLGLENTNVLNPALFIQYTPQMNLLNPQERLEAARLVVSIMDYLECEGPLLKNFQ